MCNILVICPSGPHGCNKHSWYFVHRAGDAPVICLFLNVFGNHKFKMTAVRPYFLWVHKISIWSYRRMVFFRPLTFNEFLQLYIRGKQSLQITSPADDIQLFVALWCCTPSWHLVSIDQIMACRLCGAKPLPKPIPAQCQFDPSEQTSMELQSKYILIHSFENIVCKMASIFDQPSVYMINLPPDLLLGSRSTKTNPRWQARHNRTSQTRGRRY